MWEKIGESVSADERNSAVDGRRFETRRLQNLEHFARRRQWQLYQLWTNVTSSVVDRTGCRRETDGDRLTNTTQLVSKELTEADGKQLTLAVAVDRTTAAMEHVADCRPRRR